jgi:PAS domain S-box-containing protein
MNAATSELRALLSGVDSIVLDAILENTPSMAVIASADGVILRVSRFGCELSGWEANELEGLTLSQYIATIKPRDPLGRHLNEQEIPLIRALKGERVIACEGSFSHRNGELIPIVVDAAPLARPDGRVIGAITALTDLRRYKRLEHALHELERELLTLHGELVQRTGSADAYD